MDEISLDKLDEVVGGDWSTIPEGPGFGAEDLGSTLGSAFSDGGNGGFTEPVPGSGDQGLMDPLLAF